jgi:hypothetical protein
MKPMILAKMTKADQRRVVNALQNLDLAMWGARMKSRQVSREVKLVTGIEVSSRSLSRVSKDMNLWWRTRKTRRGTKNLLSGNEWHKAIEWLKKHKGDLDPCRDTTSSIKRRMAEYGMLMGEHAAEEATKAVPWIARTMDQVREFAKVRDEEITPLSKPAGDLEQGIKALDANAEVPI